MSPIRNPIFLRNALTIIVAMLIVQSCTPFWGPSTSGGVDPTQVAQQITLIVMQTQMNKSLATLNALETAAVVPTETATSTPMPSPTSPPTWTPAFTIAPTTTPVIFPPTVIVVTATPVPGGQPLISARVNTNCRAGPSAGYQRLGYLLVGQSSSVFGRDSAWTWWYISEPRRAGVLCWVWGGSTQVTGDTSQVPVVTTTASLVSRPQTYAVFDIRGADVIMCGGEQTVMVRVRNIGDRRLESALLRIFDRTRERVIFGPSSSNSPFRSSANDCSAGIDRLNPDEALFIGASLGGRDISGHRIEVDIQMCTGEGLTNQCSWDGINFWAP